MANAHLTRLSNLIESSSKGHYTKDIAISFRDATRTSIGSNMPAKSLELKHHIKLIRELDTEIEESEMEIKTIMDDTNSPILYIPGISYRMGAMIIAEVGDFSQFDFLIEYLPMLTCRHPLINLGNWITAIHE